MSSPTSKLERLLHRLPQIWRRETGKFSTLRRYGVAVLAVAIALMLTLLLGSVLRRTPTPLFFAAIMFSSWYGGLRPGLLATVLSALSINYFFLSPTYSLQALSLKDILLLGIFICVAIFIAWLNAERQNAVKKLNANEEDLRLLLQSVKDYAIFMLDPQGYIINWNEGAERIKGYQAQEILGKHFSQFYTAEDRKIDKPNQLLKIAADLGKFEEEGWRVRKNGSLFWADVTISALRDEAGNLKGFSKVTRDITDRKLVQENLQTSLKELSDIKFALDEAAIVARTDAKGIINYVNDTFCQISKYTREELIGQDHRILNSGYHTKEFFRHLWATISSGKVWKGEIKNKAKDGSYYWVNTAIVPFMSDRGKPSQYLAIRFDITDRKLVEENLQTSLKELSDIKFALDEAAIVARTDAKGIINYVNDTFCQISKYTREELIGQDHHILNSGYHTKEFFRHLWATISSGKVWKGEIKNKAKDGSYYWVNTAIVPFMSDRGKPSQYLAIRFDITDRKQTEEALRESEERFRNMADTAPVLVWVSDTSGNYTFFNKPWLDFTGRTLEEELESGWLEGVHPADKERCLNTYISALQDRRNFRMEYRLRNADGEYRWVLDSGVPRFTPDGNFAGYIGSCIDITDRMKAEEERSYLLEREQAARAKAEASEQNYRFLAESLPQMVWTAKPSGEVDYYNQRWFEYTGLTLEELQMQGRKPLVHPDDLQQCIDRWNHSLQTGENFQIEVRMKRANGEYGWILSLAVPMRDATGQIIKWFGTNTDIDDRKRGEAERAQLLKQEKAARTVAEAATDMVQRLQAISDVALGHLSLDELLRESLNRIAEILQVDTAAVLLLSADSNSLVVRAAIGLQEEVKQEYTIPIAEGFAGRVAQLGQPLAIEENAYTQVSSPILRERRVQSLMGAPLLVENKLLGVIHVGTLNARHFTPDDMRLLQLVADRVALAIDRAHLYEAEQKARQVAEAANRLKDEFLAIVSHELRTPLNSILGWAQMLRSRKLNEGTVTKALETIERNAKQQVTLIDDILDVSRIIRGKIRLTIQQVRLPQIIHDAIETVKPAVDAKNIQLEKALDPSISSVAGDADRLHQIIVNLLSNAAKFTPIGGRIIVSLYQEGSQAHIVVSDTGKGITPDFLPHVFEGFRQEDASITRAHGGIGLGLTIVRRLVELHGGSVQAFSEGEGKGATFTVKLPLLNVVKPKDSPSIPAVSSKEQFLNNLWSIDGLRVLVVDDDVDTCDLIATVLAQYGAQVKTVNSANEAIEAIEGLIPDVLVSDIGMPEEDGYALIRRVRQLEAERGGEIRAIALTAFARDEDRRKAIQAGFHMHVAKPVEPVKLATVVASLVGQI